ncbi:MAG: hypothetical protein WAM96_07685 [Candidatus Acidiferrales bacterium]
MTKIVDQNSHVIAGEEGKRQIVKLIEAFAETVPHGDREEARELLCKKIGRTYRTIKRWKEEDKLVEEIGSDVYREAEKAGYDFTASSIRNLADHVRYNPGKSPTAIVKAAMATPKPESVKTEPIQAFVEALNAYLRNSDGDPTAMLQAMFDAPIAPEKICAALKRLCQ